MPPEDQMTCWNPDDAPNADMPVAIRRLGYVLAVIGFAGLALLAVKYAVVNGVFN